MTIARVHRSCRHACRHSYRRRRRLVSEIACATFASAGLRGHALCFRRTAPGNAAGCPTGLHPARRAHARLERTRPSGSPHPIGLVAADHLLERPWHCPNIGAGHQSRRRGFSLKAYCKSGANERHRPSTRPLPGCTDAARAQRGFAGAARASDTPGAQSVCLGGARPDQQADRLCARHHRANHQGASTEGDAEAERSVALGACRHSRWLGDFHRRRGHRGPRPEAFPLRLRAVPSSPNSTSCRRRRAFLPESRRFET